MRTILTLFSGGELVGVGARAAGFTHIGGVEIDPRIADVARNNGFSVTVADILGVSPANFTAPTLLHASPVCTRASRASGNQGENTLDIAFADKIVEFISALQPRYVTIENVPGYRKFDAFAALIAGLSREGYMYDARVLNAADFGVPQRRRRLIIRAVRGGLVPHLPQPTQWVGWYDAIRDLIDTLPNTGFAEWQKRVLPTRIETLLIGQQMYRSILQVAGKSIPSYTLTASSNQTGTRAFIVSGENTSSARAIRASEPFVTLSASSKGAHRAWLDCGRVVKLSPRALARLQSVPDDYLLPDSRTLSARIIGGGVPPLMYQRIAEAFA